MLSTVELFKKYKPHEAQVRFHRNGRRWLAAVSGTRGGKTIAGAAEFIKRAINDVNAGRINDVPATGPAHRRPRWHGWVLAPTFDLLEEPRRRLFEFIPQNWIESWNQTSQSLWLRGGILIQLRSADDPSRIVSVGLQGAWLDESARAKAEVFRAGLRMRLSDHKGWCLFTTTPLGRGWLYSDIIDRVGQSPEYGFETWKTIDNPYFDRREVIQAKADLPRKYFERDYEANADTFVGRILDEFNERTHVTDVNTWQIKTGYRLNQFKRVIAGVDFGFTSPTAIVVIGQLHNGELAMLDEVYETGLRPIHDDPKKSIVAICERLRARWNISQFVCDTEDPGAISDLVRNGIHATGANKRVSMGIRAMCLALRVRSGRPRMFVMNTCKNFIREAKTWAWATSRDGGEFLEEPAPGQSDHALDGARYALMNLLHYEVDQNRSNKSTDMSVFTGASNPFGR